MPKEKIHNLSKPKEPAAGSINSDGNDRAATKSEWSWRRMALSLEPQKVQSPFGNFILLSIVLNCCFLASEDPLQPLSNTT
jgi:hypothetical protein